MQRSKQDFMKTGKKAAEHAGAVVKGVLFIGFTVQVILGILWMGGNLLQVQDFGSPDSALYRWISEPFGGKTWVLYLLQLTAAFFAGYGFLRTLWGRLHPGAAVGKGGLVWGSLVMLTLPFAMQCHLAVLPHSFMGSFFLLAMLLLLKTGSRKRRLCTIGLAVVCGGMMVMLSGVADRGRDGRPGSGFHAAMASRVAWPTLWVDHEDWSEDLREITEDVLLESTYYPGNMVLLQEAIESSVSREKAEEYYDQMTEVGWDYHAPIVLRQMCWDVLGYGITPVAVRMQLEGRAYDSCTSRNYEIMRGNMPVLTRYYVEYGCWWFGCGMVLAMVLALLQLCRGRAETDGEGCLARRGFVFAVGTCVLLSGILIILLVMRGAGIMDYKYTIAVNELWLAWAVLPTISPKSIFPESGIGGGSTGFGYPGGAERGQSSVGTGRTGN